MSSCLFCYGMMKKQLKKLLKNRFLTGVLIAFIAFCIGMGINVLDLFNVLELKSYDLRFVSRGPLPDRTKGVVIVAIDDQTFEDLQMKWPFPRRIFAKAIANLKAAGAKLIIFDIGFTEPDAYGQSDDRQLAQTARAAGNVIFAGEVAFYKNNAGRRVIRPIKPLLASGQQWALINVPEDLDGFTRRYYLYQRAEDFIGYPFALAVYQRLFKRNLSATNGALRLGTHEIPNIANTFLINFRGPAATFPTYSLSSVLDDRSFDLGIADSDIFELHLNEWQTFKNKIVFVGATSEILQDVKLTPYFGYGLSSRKMPGVEVHANALSTLFYGDFIRPTPFAVTLVLLLCLAAFMTFLGMRSRPWAGFGYMLGAVLLFALIAHTLFALVALWIEIVRPVAVIVVAYVGTVVQQVVFERREKGRVKRTFQQYVAKSVVDTMLASGEVPHFGGERRELTVLFSDIRSFTTYCEKRSPESVVFTLNEYLTAMVEIIFKHQGTLDKFVGDEIMALYGAPLYYPEHAVRACETACEMINSLRSLQKKWSEDRKDFFQIGIGINSGPMIVGNLGSQQLFDYTVIGDEVNLAARLESANKQYATTIIISEATYRHVQLQAVVRELDLVRVKGKSRPVKIYELRSMQCVPQIEHDLIIEVYSRGLELYKQRRWSEAIKEFKRILRYFPSDGPSRLYIKRCLDFIESPPPENWDGVYDFKTK